MWESLAVGGDGIIFLASQEGLTVGHGYIQKVLSYGGRRILKLEEKV